MITTKKFTEFNLDEVLIKSLSEAGFEFTSAVQELTIEPILEGKDIFAQAETGSGKTAAFAIPILQKIIRDDNHGEIKARESLFVVMSPTRELAQQTHRVFEQLGNQSNINSVCLIGGEDIEKQKKLLANGSHILIATPGRLKDLMKQKIVSLDKCQGIVFDEADRLFDMGFKKDIEFILSKAPKDRQLIMVSATNNLDVLNTAYKFHSHPLELKLNEDSLLVDNIDHKIAMVAREEKMSLLTGLLRKQDDIYALVFCNTQYQTHVIAEWLNEMGFKAKPISGRLAQNKRTKLMEEFRNKEVTILVCTDVAARGLDIKDVDLVVNYDLPQESANYVHRIGRTGRAGKSGQAISLCAFEDCENLEGIYKFIDGKIPKMNISEQDFCNDICKRPQIDSKTLKLVEKMPSTYKTRKPQPSTRAPERKMTGEKPMRVEHKTQEREQRKTRVDQRFFEICTSDKNQADKEAMNFLRIKDQGLLGYEILQKGKRKFFFFGPRNNKYKYFIKPIFKRLLTPFLIDIIKLANLNLSVRVSYKEPHLRVNFSGKDEKLLMKDRSELLFAFEHLIRTYLSQKIEMKNRIRYSINCSDNSKNQESYLISLVEDAKQKVIESGSAIQLKPLSPADRRVIHQHLSNDQTVTTKSVGEGRFKKVEILLK